MYELPTTITLGDKTWAVRNKGDFRTVLDCFRVLEDSELTEQERLISCLIIFYEDINDIDDLNKFDDIEQAYKQMFLFFNCGQETIGASSHYKLIDWDKDSNLICSAINNVAHTEIRSAEYIHWWTFMGYYLAIGDCTLANIVSIRNKKAKGKKLEKYEREFIQDNPEYFWKTQTVEDKRLEDEIMKIWNSGGDE